MHFVAGAIITFSEIRFNPKTGEPTQALLHAILLALNLGESGPVVSSFYQDLVDEINIVTLYLTFVVSGFTACFAKLVKYCPGRQYKLEYLEGEPFHLFQKYLMLMLLATLAFFVHGLFQYILRLSRPIMYILAPLAVPGVAMYSGWPPP